MKTIEHQIAADELLTPALDDDTRLAHVKLMDGMRVCNICDLPLGDGSLTDLLAPEPPLERPQVVHPELGVELAPENAWPPAWRVHLQCAEGLELMDARIEKTNRLGADERDPVHLALQVVGSFGVVCPVCEKPLGADVADYLMPGVEYSNAPPLRMHAACAEGARAQGLRVLAAMRERALRAIRGGRTE